MIDLESGLQGPLFFGSQREAVYQNSTTPPLFKGPGKFEDCSNAFENQSRSTVWFSTLSS
jgi:hypothetical protein